MMGIMEEVEGIKKNERIEEGKKQEGLGGEIDEIE